MQWGHLLYSLQNAMRHLRGSIWLSPVLALRDLYSTFEVICDACGVRLGSVLAQGGRPFAFEGKRLGEAEQQYTTGEQKLLAAVHALQLWQCYLMGLSTQ